MDRRWLDFPRKVSNLLYSLRQGESEPFDQKAIYCTDGAGILFQQKEYPLLSAVIGKADDRICQGCR